MGVGGARGESGLGFLKQKSWCHLKGKKIPLHRSEAGERGKRAARSGRGGRGPLGSGHAGAPLPGPRCPGPETHLSQMLRTGLSGAARRRCGRGQCARRRCALLSSHHAPPPPPPFTQSPHQSSTPSSPSHPPSAPAISSSSVLAINSLPSLHACCGRNTVGRSPSRRWARPRVTAPDSSTRALPGEARARTVTAVRSRHSSDRYGGSATTTAKAPSSSGGRADGAR